MDMLELVLLGGLFGAVGQAIRETPGLALTFIRLNPTATFSMSRFMTNLSIGFVAGSLGISVLAKSAAYEISHQDIFTLLVLGYAAGDFIERILRVFAYNDTRSADSKDIG